MKSLEQKHVLLEDFGLSRRQVKRLVVSIDLVASMLTAGEHSLLYCVIRERVPADAIVLDARPRFPNSIEVWIWSASFDEIEEGHQPPIISPVCERR